MAQAYERLGKLSDAVRAYQNAVADSLKTGNADLASAALWAAGQLSGKIGDQTQAMTLFIKAAALLEQNGKIREVAWVKWELGEAQFAAGKFQDSIETFSSITKIAEQEGITDLAAGLFFWLGRSYERLSEFDQALMSYRSALRNVRAGDWKDKAKLEAGTLHNMGVIHRWLSQYEEAIENLRMAALKYQELNHLGGQAEALTQLAEIFSWIAEPTISVDYYRKALEIYGTIEDVPRRVEVLAALGEAGYLTDEVSYEDGDKYFKEGQQLIEQLTGNDPYVRVKTLGRSKRPSDDDLKTIMQEWRESLPTLQADHRKAAGILYQRWGRATLNSDLINATGMLLHAFQYHSVASPSRLVQVNREMAIELAKDAYFLGEVFRRGRATDGALKYFRTAEEIASALRTPEVHFVYTGLARTYADHGDMAKALDYYKKGIEVLDSVQGEQGTESIKIGVFAGALYEYRGFVRLLLDAYRQSGEHRYLHESFAYNQKMKARVFLEMLARAQATRASKASTSASPAEEIRRKLAQVHHRLQGARLEPGEESKLLQHLEDLRGTWRNVQSKLAQVDPRRSRLISSQVTIGEVQAILDKDAVLLEYSAAHDGSLLWAITREQISAFNLPGIEALQPMLEGYLKSLRQPLIGRDEIASHVELGRKLYTALLEPVAEMIKGKKHLIIAPDGPLYHLPFEALIALSGPGHSDRGLVLGTIQYLIKQFQITYIPSASVLVAQRGEQRDKRPPAELPLLAFGDPLYSGAKQSEKSATHNSALRGRGFSRLEFSAEEVLGIARIWGVPSTSHHINLRERASVEHLRNIDLSQYRIVHFATHAIVTDQVNVLTQPALVLSQNFGGQDGNGLLQFSDIRDLKLNADLVVLSACDTGLGRLRDGEGIVGLTRAFLYAGAASAVVSLWKVEDQSTSLLMERFYKRLKEGANKAQALRQAKLELMQTTVNLKATDSKQSFASPFYWAPFVVVGDWRSLVWN